MRGVYKPDLSAHQIRIFPGFSVTCLTALVVTLNPGCIPGNIPGNIPCNIPGNIPGNAIDW